jgi:DNA-binding winged helix-turn-helix (wHTH) protein/Tol biopolymer transport system component
MKAITLGSWTIEPHSNSITNEQGTVQLEPLVMKMLIFLAERQNQVVTRQELMGHLWGDTVVSNDSLNRIASQLRRVFQEDELVVVETIRGIGYRLTASTPELPPAIKEKTIPHTLNVVAITLLSALGLAIILYLNWSPEPEEASNPELAEYTQLPGFLLNPQISPNDDILLFSWNGGQGSKFNIYLKREGAALPTRLSEGSFDLAPIWSPEGDFVAYNAFDFATGKSNLHIQPLVGQSLRVVKDFQVLNGASPLDWSPDGKAIAASAIMPGRKEAGIYLINVEDLTVNALTRITDDSISHNTPRFSPDGEKMVFVRMNARENRINYNYSAKNSLRLIDLKTKEEQTLIESFMDPFGIEWLDNETIIYVNRQNGRSRVVSYSLKTGESEEIFSRANVNLKGFDLFHKSRKMVIEAQKSDFNVEVATLGDSTVLSQKPIIEFTSLDFSPVRDSAGKLYYISGYSGIEQIWTLASTDDKANQLTYFTQGKLLGNLTLSPAENQLAYSVKNSKQVGRIELISTDGTQREVLLEGNSDYAYPSWSLDGQSLYFYSDSLTTPQVFRMDLATRKIEQITRQQAIYGKETERGFFFVKFNTGGIWQLHEDGREEMIIDDLSFLNVSDWIIEDNTLIYLRTQNNKPAIVFFDLDKKVATREVAVPKLRMTLPSMGVSFNLKDNEIYYTSATSFTSALNTLVW